MKADLVLLAMGFTGPRRRGARRSSASRATRAATCKATTDDYRTSVDKVFAAGDMRRGQSLVVWAIREGRQCARAVDEFLMGIVRAAALAGAHDVRPPRARRRVRVTRAASRRSSSCPTSRVATRDRRDRTDELARALEAGGVLVLPQPRLRAGSRRGALPRPALVGRPREEHQPRRRRDQGRAAARRRPRRARANGRRASPPTRARSSRRCCRATRRYLKRARTSYRPQPAIGPRGVVAQGRLAAARRCVPVAPESRRAHPARVLQRQPARARIACGASASPSRRWPRTSCRACRPHAPGEAAVLARAARDQGPAQRLRSPDARACTTPRRPTSTTSATAPQQRGALRARHHVDLLLRPGDARGDGRPVHARADDPPAARRALRARSCRRWRSSSASPAGRWRPRDARRRASRAIPAR